MKKFITVLILSALMLTSCAGTVQTKNNAAVSDTSAAITEAETEPIDKLPNKDLKGYDFHILTYNNMVDEHRAVEENGESINDAVYARNMFASEKLNITFTVNDMDDSNYRSSVKNNFMANDDSYDLYQIFLSAAASMIPSGYFVDWNTIPYVNENMDKPWWNQLGIEKLRTNGRNYLLNGDIGHLTLGDSTGLIFNKKLFSDSGIEYPYKSVTDGTWTLDRLIELCSDKETDLNGDNEFKADDDRYGFMSYKWAAPVGLAVACDLNTLVYDETGYPQLNFYTEKTVDVYNKMYKLMAESNSPWHDFAPGLDIPNTISYKAFIQNRAFIIATPIAQVTKLRDMDTDFGIIPYPKYDENQAQYYSSVDAGTSSAAVLGTAADLERTGLVVEVLCEKGSELVIPAFYKNTLQGKVSRDNESEAMLDIIKDTACFDPLYVYNFGGLGFAFIDWLGAKKADISSSYTGMERNALKAIENMWNFEGN